MNNEWVWAPVWVKKTMRFLWELSSLRFLGAHFCPHYHVCIQYIYIYISISSLQGYLCGNIFSRWDMDSFGRGKGHGNLPRVSPGDVSWIVRYVPLCRLSNHERRRDDHPARHSPFDPDGRQPGWRKAGMGHTIRGKLINVYIYVYIYIYIYIFICCTYLLYFMIFYHSILPNASQPENHHRLKKCRLR